MTNSLKAEVEKAMRQVAAGNLDTKSISVTEAVAVCVGMLEEQGQRDSEAFHKHLVRLYEAIPETNIASGMNVAVSVVIKLVADLRKRAEAAEKDLENLEGPRCGRGHNGRFNNPLNGVYICVACERDEARKSLEDSEKASGLVLYEMSERVRIAEKDRDDGVEREHRLIAERDEARKSLAEMREKWGHVAGCRCHTAYAYWDSCDDHAHPCREPRCAPGEGGGK